MIFLDCKNWANKRDTSLLGRVVYYWFQDNTKGEGKTIFKVRFRKGYSSIDNISQVKHFKQYSVDWWKAEVSVLNISTLNRIFLSNYSGIPGRHSFFVNEMYGMICDWALVKYISQ